uniref:Zinc finger homeobox 4 n=1 Tax=Hucho hucho TaxID=62062 RepID=A0A4W5KHH1_9TELE
PEAPGERTSGAERSRGPTALWQPADKRRLRPREKGPNFTMEKFLDPSRPYKCTVCKESFTQKNILLVHYNSVSHLHKLKKVLQEASSPVSPESNNNADNKPFKCNICNVAYSQSSTLEIHMRSVLHHTKARTAKTETSSSSSSTGSGNTSGMAPSCIPPQFLNPAFYPQFGMTPESLLQFQQPHFLFPFYIPGAEFNLSPELALHSAAAFGMPGLTGSFLEDLKQQMQQQHQLQQAQPLIPPPRIVSGARGNAAKALLENFGFELVIQYNENRQKNQKKNKEGEQQNQQPQQQEVEINIDKLECGMCRKLFSNMLILKSHQEHIHGQFFPYGELEKFAQQYREAYDKLYPVNPPSPETPPPLPSLPPPPPPPVTTQQPPYSPYNFNIPPITTLEDIRLESQYSTLEYYRTDATMNKRSSRTRFTDYQLRVLQDFFDTNAYPKDDEIEQLSTVLNLPSRVIVVWFQNARQKARKSYENQADAKDNEKKELTNERYIRTSNMQYQCKKCSVVFPRIFDLITHQKKMCYKDEDEEGNEDNQSEEYMDIGEPGPASTPQPPPQKTPQPQMSRPHSQPQSAAIPSSPLSLALSSLTNSLSPQMLQYQCDQCKIAFPSVELWQEHQHMHFLAAQNQFLHSQFLERPMDMPYMIFDPNNPLMTSQLLSGGLQMPTQSGSGLSSGPCSGSMKRKLDEIEDGSNEKDNGNMTEEQHRDKRLRTTITPEQLEILYDKYLLDSNPTRKMLDHIAREVGLKKRVVQVWFQNTRARERKGQFRALGASQSHKKCPFCRAGFSLPNSPMMNQDDGGESPHKYNFFEYPQLPTKTELNDPSLSYSGKDGDSCSYSYSYYSSRDDDMDDNNDQSETSSLADPSSPSPFGSGNPFRSGKGSGSGGERPGHKRFRTQMSNLQLKVLKACFSDYRTPTMQECEMLGSEIGLPKRVVQVWFQNARAKEKKFKINIGKPFMISQGGPDGPRPECTLCSVKYTARMSIRDHIFSKQHITKVQETLVNQVDREKDYLAPTTVRQLMAHTTPNKTLLQTPPPPPPLPPVSSTPLTSTNHIEQHSKYQERESNNNSSSSSKKPAEKPHHQKKAKEREAENGGHPQTPNVSNNKKREKPSPASGKPGRDLGHLDAAQLQALQNALAGAADPNSFLGGQFLPYFLPGFANSFSPQLLGGMQAGGYFPPFGGMENLFPYGPAAIPQAAMAGMNPTALLQQYQQYHTKEPPTETKRTTDFHDGFIIPSVKHQFICRKCQMVFADEDSALHHQKSFCYFGNPFPDPQETILRKAVSKYRCIACNVVVNGNEALGQHLQLSSHKEKTIKQAMRNAKEHARLLPHSVCTPTPGKTTSTSQSAAPPSNNTFPHLSRLAIKSWPDIFFQATTRKAASSSSSLSASPIPPLSLPLMVTSTSCSSVSGVPISLPNESCSDESDNELSQKLDDLDKVLEVKAQSTSGLDAGFSSIRMDMFSV